ncbi:Protein indc11 [Paramyrothecium foliicola]|nr:Protein indc11 [Paramyrothecium foliicola]
MTTHSIRKVQVSKLGDPSVISVIDAQISPPAKNEVQVDIHYAGFSGTDINMRQGTYPMQKAAPLTPGYCFVGRISAHGSGASKFQPGQLVGAITVYDSQAEKINIPERYLIAIPDNVDMREACAVLVDWSTAYGLCNHATKITKGKRVFIHGISGAVGYAIMSLCLLEGATIYGTASERNHDSLRAIGVTPFDYKDKKWIEAMKATGGAHVVYDPLGFESFDESWDILIRHESSILVGYGGNLNIFGPGKPRSQFTSMMKLLAKNGCLWTKRSTTFYYIDRDRATSVPDLQNLMQMLSEAKFQVPIKAVWELENIREPHENWGKVPGMGSCLIRVHKDA